MEATLEQQYDELFTRQPLEGVEDGRAVDLTATLVDVATDLRRPEGLRHAVGLIRQLLRRDLPAPLAVQCHYSLVLP